MSDEEDDYMSSSFLDVKEDIRPGLLPKSVKRKLDIEKKRIDSNKLFKTKSRKELEEESRNAGLDSALTSDNKGFAMLQKMGYKPGMKLGAKEKNPESGLAEPIRIEVKAGRGGLGREQEVRRRIEQREAKKQELKVYRELETRQLTREFRERMRNKIEDKRQMGDLRQCQRICEQLDVESGVVEPMRTWFWYTSKEEEGDDEEYDEYEDDEEEEEDDLTAEEKINFICEYVRPKYFYCCWCGIKYESEDDMSSNCPGVEKFAHDDDLS